MLNKSLKSPLVKLDLKSLWLLSLDDQLAIPWILPELEISIMEMSVLKSS